MRTSPSASAAQRWLAACLAGYAGLTFALSEPPLASAAASGLRWRDLRGLAPLWLFAGVVGCATAMYDFLLVVHPERLGGDAPLAALGVGAGVSLEVALMAAY